MKYVDAHIHLPIFKRTAHSIIKKSEEFGVTHLVSVSTNSANSVRNVELCSEYDNVSAFIGTHPFCFGSPYRGRTPGMNPKWLYQEIYEIAELAPKANGIGEVGIDHFLVPDLTEKKRKEQRYLFSKMCQIAEKNKKPIIVHCLDAAYSVYDVLDSYRADPVIMHSFKGTKGQLRDGIDRGYYFSVMAKNPDLDFYPDMEMVIDEVPVDKLLVESDAPRKEDDIADSSVIPLIANEIAKRKKLPYGETAWEIYETSKKLFSFK